MRSWIRSMVCFAGMAAPLAAAHGQELIPPPSQVGPAKKLPTLSGDIPPAGASGSVGGSANGNHDNPPANGGYSAIQDGPLPLAGETGTFIGEEAVVAPSAGAGAYPSLLPAAHDRFSVRGWVNGGYVFNGGHPGSGFNGPYNATDYANQGQFNQAYLIAEWLLPRDGTWGFGGRVDALYGSDFILAQSVGLEVNRDGSRKWNGSQYYGVAMPQAYGQVGTNDLNVKVGHFYSIVGLEGVPATGNFFYSKSYSYQFAGPFTHWGALGYWKLNDCWSVQAGAHMGWNTLDGEENHVSGIAGIKYERQNMWASFAVTSGSENTNVAGLRGIPNDYANRTRYSFIVDINPNGGPVEYVFHHWLGWQNEGNTSGGTASWYGIDQYAYYKINDCWKFGGRFEWFRDVDGTRVGLNRPANPNKPPLEGNYFSATLGFNWQPMPNLVIRPEARYDWVNDNVALPYNDGSARNQFMLAVDAIFKF